MAKNNTSTFSPLHGGIRGGRYLISGGGTGGHIFPAVSIANALKELDPEAEILFVGALGRMEMERVPQAGQLGVAVNGAVDVVLIEDNDGLQGAGLFLVVLAGKREDQQGKQQGER